MLQHAIASQPDEKKQAGPLFHAGALLVTTTTDDVIIVDLARPANASQHEVFQHKAPGSISDSIHSKYQRDLSIPPPDGILHGYLLLPAFSRFGLPLVRR